MASLAAEEPREAKGYFIIVQRARRLGWVIQVAKVGVAGQDQLGRLHEELRGRFASVQGDQLELGELIEI